MKKYLSLILLSLIALSFSACKSKPTTNAEGESADESGSAVCIWDKVSLKESPDKDGKWITSINIGEKCTYLDDEKEVANGDKNTKYIKVQLQDGKQGWVQADFVIVGGKAGAIVQDATIYSRPDLLTKTDKSFSQFDIVALKSEQNNFVEVVGKRKDGKWIETGWIKPSNTSSEDIDVAVAKYASKALANEDEDQKIRAITEIIENPDFSGSAFIPGLRVMISGDEESDYESDEEVVEDSTMSEGD